MFGYINNTLKYRFVIRYTVLRRLTTFSVCDFTVVIAKEKQSPTKGALSRERAGGNKIAGLLLFEDTLPKRHLFLRMIIE